MKPLLLLALTLGALTASGVEAAGVVALHDRAQLAAALADGAPCCVIDARPAKMRASRPLSEALVYRKGMKINPTAAVVVIAATDENAMRVGEDVARTSNASKVIAVKGGYSTWEAATAAGRTTAAASLTFIIPKNTCEQDAPLQQLRAAPR